MAWGQAIATTLGGAGNDYGRAVDSNIDTALKVIQNKLVSAEIQQRMREQELRMKQMQVPHPEGTYATPQGVVGTTFDPNTGKYGGGMIPGTQPTVGISAIDPHAIEQLIGTLPPERQASARKLIPIFAQTGMKQQDIVKFLEQESMKEPPPKADKTPSKDDRYIAISSKPRDQWTPEEAAFVKGYKEFVNLNKVQPGVARMEVLMNTREFPTLSNGQLQYMTPAQISAAQKSGTGAAPASPGVQAMTKEAVFQDIHFNVQQTRKALNDLDDGFSPTSRAQIAFALTSQDRPGALSAFLNSSAGQALSESQVNYITALASLNENAMALRGVAGMGQGSDDLRNAIRNAIPGAGTPNKKYGNRQLDLFEGTVNRLQTAVPGLGGNTATPPAGATVKTYNPKTGQVE